VVAPSKRSITLIDTLSFNLDSLTSPKSWIFQFKVINDTPYYLLVNKAAFALQAYQFGKKYLFKRIVYEKQGPDKNVLNENFYFHTWDSIFFFSTHPNKVSLFDSTGKKKHVWNISLKPEHEGYILTTMEYYFRPYFNENRVGFWITPPVSPHKVEFYEKAKAVEYNLRTGNYVTYGDYPQNYLLNDISYMALCPINGYLTDQYNLLYYEASANIYLYDRLSKNLVKIINAKSKYLPSKIPGLATKNGENYPTVNEREKYYISTGFYEYMFTNENYTYHFRIVKHQTDMKSVDGSWGRRDDYPFSIMIFDADFQLIDEIQFPPGKYDYRQSFAYGDKMYISLNNPLNDEIDEDHLRFEVYLLK